MDCDWAPDTEQHMCFRETAFQRKKPTYFIFRIMFKVTPFQINYIMDLTDTTSTQKQW